LQITADYTKRIAALSPEKRMLLARQLQQRGREFNSFPLSFAQQRLWFIDQLEPGNTAYNMPAAVRYIGTLDLAALERSIAEIFRRHEAVRTKFADVDGEPVQIVMRSEAPKLNLIDLSELAERETEAARLAREEAHRQFDLSRGPMLRASVLKLAAAEHVVLLTMHHIASDGWSMNILLRELATLYGAFANGQPSPLAELPIQYADFAQWQRRHLQGKTLDQHLQYWTTQLAGAPEVMELPTARPRPAVQSYRGANQMFLLTEATSQKIKTIARDQDATLFMALLSAFKVLLFCSTGQHDVVVGSPVAGRHQLQTEGLIGFFVNMLVLRTIISGELSFNELLAQVRDTTLGAYAHQDVPFERLVDALRVERGAGHHPLFQVVFTTQNILPEENSDSSAQPQGEMRPFGIDIVSTPYDLILDTGEMGNRIGGSLSYNVDLFEDETAAGLVQLYGRLLDEIVADPTKPIKELLAHGGNETRTDLQSEEFDF
jgi:Condensation domain